jgi:hypothetical protein
VSAAPQKQAHGRSGRLRRTGRSALPLVGRAALPRSTPGDEDSIPRRSPVEVVQQEVAEGGGVAIGGFDGEAGQRRDSFHTQFVAAFLDGGRVFRVAIISAGPNTPCGGSLPRERGNAASRPTRGRPAGDRANHCDRSAVRGWPAPPSPTDLVRTVRAPRR